MSICNPLVDEFSRPEVERVLRRDSSGANVPTLEDSSLGDVLARRVERLGAEVLRDEPLVVEASSA